MSKVYTTSFANLQVDVGSISIFYESLLDFRAAIRDIDCSYAGPPGASMAIGYQDTSFPVQSPLLFDGSTWQWTGRFVIPDTLNGYLAVGVPSGGVMTLQISGFLLSLP